MFSGCVRQEKNIFSDCDLVEEFRLSSLGCNVDISVLKTAGHKFAVNMAMDKVVRAGDRREGICSVIGADLKPKEAIAKWLGLVSHPDRDPFWDVPPSPTPLAESSPQLQINLPFFSDRTRKIQRVARLLFCDALEGSDIDLEQYTEAFIYPFWGFQGGFREIPLFSIVNPFI